MKSSKTSTAHKRAKTSSTRMETSSRMGKTTRSKTSRSKNCGRNCGK